MGAVGIAVLLAAMGLLIGSSFLPDEDEIRDFFADDDNVNELRDDPRFQDFFSDDDDPAPNNGATDGDDILAFGDGSQNVSAGDGDDVVSSGQGYDFVRGGNGDDTLDGGRGSDVLGGNAGDDTLIGGAWHDVLDGGTGKDDADGGSGDDLIFGREDADTLFGGEGADVLVGNEGSDELTGGKGSDILVGGDFLNREPYLREWNSYFASSDPSAFDSPIYPQIKDDDRQDTLVGGEGQDILFLGSSDIATGGDDQDVFMLSANELDDFETAEITDYSADQDVIAVTYSSGAAPNVEVEHDEDDAIINVNGIEAIRVTGAAAGDDPLEANDIQVERFDPSDFSVLV